MSVGAKSSTQRCVQVGSRPSAELLGNPIGDIHIWTRVIPCGQQTSEGEACLAHDVPLLSECSVGELVTPGLVKGKKKTRATGENTRDFGSRASLWCPGKGGML